MFNDKVNEILTYKYDKDCFLPKDKKVNCLGLCCFFSEQFFVYCRDTFFGVEQNSVKYCHTRNFREVLSKLGFDIHNDISKIKKGDIILIKNNNSRYFSHAGYALSKYDIIHAKDENTNVCIENLYCFLINSHDVLILSEKKEKK